MGTLYIIYYVSLAWRDAAFVGFEANTLKKESPLFQFLIIDKRFLLYRLRGGIKEWNGEVCDMLDCRKNYELCAL